MIKQAQSVHIELANLIIQHIFNVTFEQQSKPQHTFVNDPFFLGITNDEHYVLFRWIKEDREYSSSLLARLLDNHGVAAIQNKDFFSSFIKSIKNGDENAFVKK